MKKDFIIEKLNEEDITEFKQMFCDYFEFDCNIKLDKALIEENVINQQILPSFNKGVIYIDILKQRDKLLGFIMYQIDSEQSDWNEREGSGFIREFYIKPEYRRLGFGSMLLNYAENQLKKAGVKQIYLTCNKNDYVKKFYLKNDYIETNVFHKNGNEYLEKMI